MFFSIQELELRKIRFEKAFDPGQVEFPDEGLRQPVPLEVQGVAELAGPLQEIRVRGSMQGAFATECDRCLEPVTLPVGGPFDLFYRPESQMPSGEEHGISTADTDIGYYEGAGLELADVVREQVLLWLPMQRLCRRDCKGICPQCGQNRNVIDCDCQGARIDERWAALKKLSGE